MTEQGRGPSTMSNLDELMSEHRLCGPKYDGCYSHFTFMEHCRADGMVWPCDVDRIRAALSAAAESEEG